MRCIDQARAQLKRFRGLAQPRLTAARTRHGSAIGVESAQQKGDVGIAVIAHVDAGPARVVSVVRMDCVAVTLREALRDTGWAGQQRWKQSKRIDRIAGCPLPAQIFGLVEQRIPA